MGAQRSIDPNIPQFQMLRETGNGPTVTNEAELLTAEYDTPSTTPPPVPAPAAAPARAAEGGAA
jgi:hypothetical protein